MRILKTILVTVALLAGVAVVAPPANAAQAYGAAFTMGFWGDNWPCSSTCTNGQDYSWAYSTFYGISGGPSWDEPEATYSVPVSITYTSTNCTTDDWYVTIDSTNASGGGSNTGTIYIYLHRVGTVFTGSAYFVSNYGVGDGNYTMSGHVTPSPYNVDTANACLGGPKAAAYFSWDGVMESVTV
ncbi:MAG: hypothetical protein QOC82_3324 [Frankiaceae bacterium]|jgi:hypothetical protein|nr:hypothetical protein [Frankiaceae bacterium]